MLNGKVYVVTSPEMVNAVNRNAKKIAFNPFIAMLGKRITDHDEETSRIVQHNLNGENGPGYVIDVHDGIVSSLAPGNALEEMTRSMLLQASKYFEALAKGDEINLFEWTRQMVTMCSTRAVYGPKNPFNANPDYVSLFWQFDHDLNLLIADVLPSVTAPKGYNARKKLAAAFQEYFEAYDISESQSSAMIRARYVANAQHGLTTDNQARLEVGTLLGILANTIPSIFYMLVHIYSDPALTADIREELANAGLTGTPEELAANPHLLSMPEVCPLLFSAWQELLRVHALGASSRFVLEDVFLDDRVLLKRGMVVQMPMAVMHHDPAAWGSDVKDFEPRRFQKAAKGGIKQTSYRPFGGGASLCPGRHFVTLETMALVACMLSMFDVNPVEGLWFVPIQKQESMATNVFPPEHDVRVKISSR
ncbi:hypothetical protein ACLMJK_007911 [Lecanora helva]